MRSGMVLMFMMVLVLMMAFPASAAVNASNVELLRPEHKVIDGKMKVTADVRVQTGESVSVLAIGYDKTGKIIAMEKDHDFIFQGHTEVFELMLERGEEIKKVEVQASGAIEEPYKIVAETTVIQKDYLEAMVAVKNGAKVKTISAIATAYNKKGKVVEVSADSDAVFENNVAIFKIKLQVLNEIDHVSFMAVADDQTYLVDYGTYIKDGKLVFTSVVKNGEKTQKIMARVTPYSADGKELSVVTNTDVAFNNRTDNLRMEIKDPSASSLAVKFYNETGKQEIVKRGILITIDGKGLATEQPPVNMDGNVLVPMRAIFEALGATLEWEQSTKTVTATKGSKEIKLQIGSDQAHIDGQKTALSVPPQLINSNTMVPVRFVSEALGAKVFWNQASRTVLIVR